MRRIERVVLGVVAAGLVACGSEPQGPDRQDVEVEAMGSLLQAMQAAEAAGEKCTTVDEGAERMARDMTAGERPVFKTLARNGGPGNEIAVAYHVLSASSGQGNVPEAMLDAQTAVLNADFKKWGFRFRKVLTTRTVSDGWFRLTGSMDRAVKKELAVDPARTLNIYVANLGQNLLGWAYYPWSFPEDHYMHGVVVHYASLPGGGFRDYGLGKTATHEVGHYLGLAHTFAGGCADGDYCADTPAEATPNFGCPASRDTCAAPGLDPIHNYMDYSDDVCLTEFTEDQAARMAWAVSTYRPSL